MGSLWLFYVNMTIYRNPWVMKIYKWSVTPSMDAARIIQFGVQKETSPTTMFATQGVLKQWNLGEFDRNFTHQHWGLNEWTQKKFHLAFTLRRTQTLDLTCSPNTRAVLFGSGMEFPLECWFGKNLLDHHFDCMFFFGLSQKGDPF